MTSRVVIADAGPLIALARIQSIHLLRLLFGRITVTQVVLNELLPQTSRFEDTELLKSTMAEGWIDVVDQPLPDYQPLNPGVDAGEASAIALALQYETCGDAVLLIMDDRAARLEAKHRGLRLIGTAAILGLAKRSGFIAEARPLLERLTRSGYFIGPSVIAAVLTDLGE